MNEGEEEEEGGSTAPACLHWDKERVADWVESVGFKDYRVSAEKAAILKGTEHRY